MGFLDQSTWKENNCYTTSEQTNMFLPSLRFFLSRHIVNLKFDFVCPRNCHHPLTVELYVLLYTGRTQVRRHRHFLSYYLVVPFTISSFAIKSKSVTLTSWTEWRRKRALLRIGTFILTEKRSEQYHLPLIGVPVNLIFMCKREIQTDFFYLRALLEQSEHR
jgi:hypothetical protein